MLRWLQNWLLKWFRKSLDVEQSENFEFIDCYLDGQDTKERCRVLGVVGVHIQVQSSTGDCGHLIAVGNACDQILFWNIWKQWHKNDTLEWEELDYTETTASEVD